jgi:hypothetical protein
VPEQKMLADIGKRVKIWDDAEPFTQIQLPRPEYRRAERKQY